MSKVLGSLSKQDFNDWRIMEVTKRLFAMVDMQIEDIKGSMSSGSMIRPEKGNGHHNLIELLGMLKGLEMLQQLLPEDLLTDEELNNDNVT